MGSCPLFVGNSRLGFCNCMCLYVASSLMNVANPDKVLTVCLDMDITDCAIVLIPYKSEDMGKYGWNGNECMGDVSSMSISVSVSVSMLCVRVCES